MSTEPLLNSNAKIIEDLYDDDMYDIEIDTINNQSFTSTSPNKFEGFVFGSNKNAFPPKPVLRRQAKVFYSDPSVLGKRKFQDAFIDEDDERYGQHIGEKFFKNNVGHNVRPTSPNPNNWEDNSWNEYIQKEGRRERDSESKYDPEEILEWCYRYLANKNIIV